MKLTRIAGKANQNLYRHPETQIIYFCLAKKGKGRIQRSTKTDVLTEARKIADEFRFEFLGQRNPKHGRKLVKELFPEWLETKKIRRPRTFDRYRLSWEHMKPWAEDLGPEDLTERWWTAAYIPGKRQQAPGHHFFNDRKALRGFLSAMRDERLVDLIPKFPNPDPESDAGKVFTDDEIERLIKAASEDLKLQILMAVEMFMRKGEILLLSLDRIDASKRFLTLKSEDTKTKKERTIPITDRVWTLIETRLGHPSGFLFPSRTGEAKPVDRGGNQTAWEGAKKRAGITGRFHDLRHTALSKSLTRPGANIAKICLYAGLSLEVAERVYLHIKPEDLRDVAATMGEIWESVA